MKSWVIEYDILRVITICLVVIGHCDYYDIVTDYGGICSHFDSSNRSLITQIVYKITRCIYTFHMPLFMALSGALWSRTISLKTRFSGSLGGTLLSVIDNKFKRLIVPMLYTAFLWSIPLKYLSGYWDCSDNIISDIFLGQIIMYGNFNSHLWFLQALFWCFLFSWVIERFTPFHRYIWRVISCLFVLSCVGIKMQSMGMCLLNITSAFQYLFWFYVGFYFDSKRIFVNECLIKHHYILLLSISIFILSWAISLFIPSFIRPIFYFSNALLGMFAVYTISYALSRTKLVESKIIRILSISSFSIYLFSDPINYPLIRLVIDSNILTNMWFTNLGFLMLFFTRFILTFIGALALEFLINYKRYVKTI